MNFIGGADSFRYFKIISVNNKKVKDEGRYKTRGSPGDAAKKAFTQLSKKYNTNKLTFSIKETTQGSTKKEHGPYLGEKTKLKKPLEIKYKGKKKPVLIKYETKIHLVKDHKQKGGRVTNKQLEEFEYEMEEIKNGAKSINPNTIFLKGEQGYLKNYGLLKNVSEKTTRDEKRQIVADKLTEQDLEHMLELERNKLLKLAKQIHPKAMTQNESKEYKKKRKIEKSTSPNKREPQIINNYNKSHNPNQNKQIINFYGRKKPNNKRQSNLSNSNRNKINELLKELLKKNPPQNNSITDVNNNNNNLNTNNYIKILKASHVSENEIREKLGNLSNNNNKNNNNNNNNTASKINLTQIPGHNLTNNNLNPRGNI